MRFAAASGRNLPDFTPQGLKSAGVTTNAGSAADAVSVGSIYGSLRDSAPDYDVSSLKYLLDEVVDYYSLYLKKEEQYKDMPREEQKYQRKYEDGLRVSIREYLDEY